jgi:CRP/FNR family cyclic AMP-dependent transcriptional regulator
MRSGIAGDVDLLGLLSNEARSRLLVGSRSVTLAPGTVTYYQPHEPVADYVEAGLVRIFVSSPDGRQASFSYVHGHSFYGAPTILGVPMPTVVQTLTSTKLIRLNPDHVRALFDEDLEVAKALGLVMASRIGQSARLVTVRSLGTVRERLAYDLLERASDERLRGGSSSFEVTQEELAESIGSVREVISRAVAELRREGIVGTGPGLVKVLDIECLASIVDGLI